MKKTAVVILNWNGRELLEQFLPSILKHTTLPNVEIVVADNGSTDNSISFLERSYPTVRSIVLDDNYGFAEGYNRALKQIDADYFVLLNSDVEVTCNWLTPMINYLNINQDIACLQPKVLAYSDKDKFEYAGAAGGFLDLYGYPFCRGRIFDEVETDKGQYNTPCEIFWATGACMVIRANVYFDCGGLDASFFAHMEEIDLCWRLWSRGHKIVCLPQSVVYHVGGATLNEESPRKTFLNFRNNLLMLYKNLPNHRVKKVLRYKYFLDHLAIINFVIQGKSANAKAIRQAYKEFKKIKSQYTDMRSDNQSKTTSYTIPTIYNKSVVWQFYVKRKKLFSKIRFK